MELKEFGINTRTANALNKKKIYTVNDLALNLPMKYKDYKELTPLTKVQNGTFVAVKGHLMSVEKENRPGEVPYIKAKLMDEENGVPFSCSWFGDTRMYKVYAFYCQNDVVVAGKVKIDPKYGIQFSSPDYFEPVEEFRFKIYPKYRKIKDISESNLKKNILAAIKSIKEPLEKEVIERFEIADYKDSICKLQYPKSMDEIGEGLERLILNQQINFNIKLQLNQATEKQSQITFTNFNKANEFVKMLPYKLTADQTACIKKFIENMKAGKRNNLLIQGDVGCGKSVVAFALMVFAAASDYQAMLIAPTQILAKQHFAEMSEYAKELGLECVYFDSKLKAKEKKEVIKKIVTGEAKIIIGTGAVISKDVIFENLGLVIVDEEQKFGTEKKEAIVNNENSGIHSILLSATPIPRSLAHTLYGNKEIIQIKSRPEGRLPIKNAQQKYRVATCKFMEGEIKAGHQCYVVCPAIEDSDETDILSVEKLEELYNDYFKEKGIKVGVVHGKQKKDVRDAMMKAFVNNEIQVLISTTVIEVGINVPNATVMVVEQAERFGVSTLHQLRGRVGRSNLQSYCIFITEDTENERIKLLCSTNDGFVLAEEDMKLRGAGNLIGTEQTGDSVFLENIMKYPDIQRHAKNIATFCVKNGYGKELMKLFDEHERFEEEN